MTMVITAELQSVAEMIPLMAYLLGMILQIYMYCWTGSEIVEAVCFYIYVHAKHQNTSNQYTINILLQTHKNFFLTTHTYKHTHTHKCILKQTFTRTKRFFGKRI